MKSLSDFLFKSYSPLVLFLSSCYSDLKYWLIYTTMKFSIYTMPPLFSPFSSMHWMPQSCPSSIKVGWTQDEHSMQSFPKACTRRILKNSLRLVYYLFSGAAMQQLPENVYGICMDFVAHSKAFALKWATPPRKMQHTQYLKSISAAIKQQWYPCFHWTAIPSFFETWKILHPKN